MEAPAAEANTRLRKERLAKAMIEKRRRSDLKIKLNKEGEWVDVDTNAPVSKDDIMRREVALERNKPSVEDFDQKVIVDRKWLRAVVGDDEYNKAIEDGHARSLRSWL